MKGTITQRISAGIAGAFSSMFMGPIVTPLLYAAIKAVDAKYLNGAAAIDILHVASFTGFILGVAGMGLVVGIQKATRAGGERAASAIKGG